MKMIVYSEKNFAKKMDSSPRFFVAFIAIAAAATWVAGWGLMRCIDLFCDAVGFAASALPFVGLLALSVVLLVIQACAMTSAKGTLEHVKGSADNFKKSYAALYAFCVAATLFLSWDPMLVLWECAKICWASGGFEYALACLLFLLSAIGICAAVCGVFGFPIVALLVLFDVPGKVRGDEMTEVSHD